MGINFSNTNMHNVTTTKQYGDHDSGATSGPATTLTGPQQTASPTTTVKDDQSVNPFSIRGMIQGAGRKLRAALPKLPGLAATALHVVGQAEQSLSKNPTLTEAVKTLNKIFPTPPEITPPEAIEAMQVGMIENVKARAIDDATMQDVITGVPGARNHQIGAKVTPTTIVRVAQKLEKQGNAPTESEKRAADIIFGTDVTDQPIRSDVPSKALREVVTIKGTVKQVQHHAEIAEKKMNEIDFRLLLEKSQTVINKGFIPTTAYNTDKDALMIGQHTNYVKHFTQGIVASDSKIDAPQWPSTVTLSTSGWKATSYHLYPTSYFWVPTLYDGRDVVLTLKGTLSVDSAPYDAQSPIRICGVAKDVRTGVLKVMPGLFSNRDSKSETLPGTHSGAVVSGSTISLRTEFEITCDLNGAQPFDLPAALSITQTPPNPKVAQSQVYIVVFGVKTVKSETSPVLQVGELRDEVTIQFNSEPSTLTYAGKPYAGSVVEMLGQLSPNFSPADPFEIQNVYRRVIDPFIPYIPRIIESHLSGRLASALTRDELRELMRLEGKTPSVDDSVIDAEIKKLMAAIPTFMFTNSPIAAYTPKHRILIFLRLVYTVCSTAMSNINVVIPEREGKTSELAAALEQYNLWANALQAKLHPLNGETPSVRYTGHV